MRALYAIKVRLRHGKAYFSLAIRVRDDDENMSGAWSAQNAFDIELCPNANGRGLNPGRLRRNTLRHSRLQSRSYRTPRLWMPTTTRFGTNVCSRTLSALRGSALPHMNTSNAA